MIKNIVSTSNKVFFGGRGTEAIYLPEYRVQNVILYGNRGNPNQW